MKMRSLIKTTFLLMALLLPATAIAQDFEVDGIYYSINGNEVTVTRSGSQSYSGDVTIPAAVTYNDSTYSVTAIDDRTFDKCSGLTSVTIPNSVISIGYRAFYGCSGLKSMTIPNSVITIGNGAFSYCSELTSVTISNSLIKISNRMFSSCRSLTSVTIPNSIISIGDDAFGWCSGLTSVDIPNSVTAIGNSSFYDCENLTSINIPNSVTTIGEAAFGNSGLTSVTIPNSVYSIGREAFYGCLGLTSVTIPNSVTSIGTEAFAYCCYLTSITVETGNPMYDSRDECNAIIETASNTLIAGCQTTVFPNSVTSIGNGAFRGCYYLTSLTIPNSITSIGSQAFTGCIGLKSLTIPNSITVIGDYAFSHCSFLKDVYCYITNPSRLVCGNGLFYIEQSDYDYSGRTLHVPNGTAHAYQADSRWYPYFGQIVEMEAETVLIGDVNGDGDVDLADINALVDIILGENGDTAAADVNNDGEINIGDLNAIINIIQTTETGDDEHEWVDLGLPSGTLWAAYNVGADAPEEYGDYFAWGETEPKEVYDWSTYKWCNGTNDSLTKYCSTNGYGVLDHKNELDCEDDAAYVNWGPLWCMPTHEQQVELMNVCTWTQTTLNGVNGYLVTGPNGNKLFFPYTGERSGSELMYAGSSAGYWPRTLFAADAGQIMYLRWNEVRTAWTYRCMGYTVRAVRSQQLIVEQQNFDFGEVPIGQTRRGELTIINNTAEAQTLTVSADEPFLLEQGEGSASSITVVVPGNSSGTVKVVYTATEPGEFNGNVTFQSPAFDGGERVIPVQAFAYSDNVPEHRYVDLGLPSGTLWATCNVGASAPEEFGDYFAWGETEPKEDYLWTTYKWCNGSDQTLTKYCTYDYFGTVDSLTVLYPEDDAATVNWGSSWCMPTEDQFLELYRLCSKIWTTRNGVNGYLYIGPSGNTLFLPATGKRIGSSLQESGTRGYYWSRSLVEDITYSAWCLNFGLDYMHSSSNSRNLGITVRAVRMSQE